MDLAPEILSEWTRAEIQRLVLGYAARPDQAPTVDDAYRLGRLDRDVQRQYDRRHLGAIREALDAWRLAQFDHAHTSYYGLPAIRRLRAYWLGVARKVRGT